jgi:AraC family transcriptional regulator of adaptative response / DNA-3-methyladenine glycosylase II
VAQTRRVLFAKQLIHETRMPMTEIALAAGFGSVRRFNETFQNLFQRPPSALRRRTSGSSPNVNDGISLRLRYRPPYDWRSIIGFLQARAIAEVEVVENEHYLRTVAMEGCTGTIDVSHQPEQQSICVRIRFPNVRALPAIVARVRRQFDIGADIETIDAHLSNDPLLAPLIAKRPGLRAPGGWDGFELAVRAILGQQISVAAARRLAGQMVALHGKRVPNACAAHSALSRAFPTAERLASVESLGLGMPAARLAALKALATAAVADPGLFRQAGTIQATIERLKAIRGVGEWTAQYIALRAVREMDAFPSTDVGLLRSAAIVGRSAGITAQILLNRAESWRPWRAYAAQHLWAAEPALLQEKDKMYE